MLISVPKIPSDGLSISQGLAREDIGLEDCGFEWPEPLDVQARVHKVGHTVIASVNVRMKFIASCARCLDKVPREERIEFDLDYPIEEFPDEINLGEDIRQEIIMRLPMKVLCREDCQGMCVQCGVNLNKEKCICKDKNKS